MPVQTPDALERYEKAQRKKPHWPEKKWRKAGWKLSPTPYQLWRDLDGVCRDCRPEVIAMRRPKHYFKLFVGGAIALLMGISAWVLTRQY
jgi:hypothetical protein